MHPNVRLCEAARRRGFDSIQLVAEDCHGGDGSRRTAPHRACYHEVVSCHDGCLALPNKR